ncbi:uncharacterized protein BJ171DRAFT_503027 [Polychytrium aggregatum]|uniref:uncharacterized protein n=1 Tax=Polychytrium aggregatum TaxID=110093 RepID=UPI0022FDB381|nr:uncharacterized protein BJ171DRAFT_503027 [Polychytrium aggregatum]KAI9205112.1 hypothetical protein BJ171DRAFT_503027 [Polychytrium aggregatum]
MSEQTKHTPLSLLTPYSADISVRFKVVDLLVQVKLPAHTPKQHRVAEFLVGDESGIAIVQAKDDQIDRLVVGETFVMSHARAKMYDGYLRLVSDPFQVESIALETPLEIQTQTDASSVLWEYGTPIQ